jgi:hypothetical protein
LVRGTCLEAKATKRQRCSNKTMLDPVNKTISIEHGMIMNGVVEKSSCGHAM